MHGLISPALPSHLERPVGTTNKTNIPARAQRCGLAVFAHQTRSYMVTTPHRREAIISVPKHTSPC